MAIMRDDEKVKSGGHQFEGGILIGM